MEKEIFKLKESNQISMLQYFLECYKSTRVSLFNAVTDYILHMPHKHALISGFVLEACNKNEEFRRDFLVFCRETEIKKTTQFLSFLLVLNDLEKNGFLKKGIVAKTIKLTPFCENGGLKKFIGFEDEQSVDLSEEKSINIDLSIKDLTPKEMIASSMIVDQENNNFDVKVCEDLEIDIFGFMNEFENAKKNDEDFRSVIYGIVIENLCFNTRECATQFNGVDYICVKQLAYAFIRCCSIIDRWRAALLCVEFAYKKGFLSVFYDHVDSRILVHCDCLAFLYENFYACMHINKGVYENETYYNPIGVESEVNKFISICDSSVINQMLRYSRQESLRQLFDVPAQNAIKGDKKSSELKRNFLRRETPKMEKDEFFRSFFILGSPSISHFLSLLESNIDYFYMDENEQQLFCNIFNEVFEGKIVFKEVVAHKLQLFGIISEKFADALK